MCPGAFFGYNAGRQVNPSFNKDKPVFRFISLIMLFSTIWMTATDEPFRQTLTSAARNLRLDTWQLTHRDVGFESAAPWSVRKYTLHGGKQEGVDVIVVDNGRLAFTVVPTRGMSVLRVEMGDIRLGWDSPVQEVVHPQFINLQSRGGLGWLEGFNEWMVRCGLEWAGHPGKDEFINNTGDKAEMDLTLHGKVGNIPASEVEVVVERTPPHRIHIRGRVDEHMFYGPKLKLWTEISTEPGSNSYRIEDSIRNQGAYDQEFELIYHANYGPPLGANVRIRRADARLRRTGLCDRSVCRREKPHDGDAAQRSERQSRDHVLFGCGASLFHLVEEYDGAGCGLCDGAGTRHEFARQSKH
jgi:Domain of unknown function (DUF4432)